MGTLTRSARRPPLSSTLHRFTPERLSPGYFAFVMGTGILSIGAAQRGRDRFSAALIVLAASLAGIGIIGPAAALLVIGSVSWLLLGYAVPWASVLGRSERPVTAAANGTWFIWVVAAQSVSVVAATLEPEQFQPPYWVSMGAIAITIVAGARIVEMQSTPMVDAVRGLVAGAAVVLWCFATWLIPVLFAAGVWRHGLKKVPLRYTPTLWSIVFPLGMYAVAGMYLGRADHLPIVARIGELWIWVALAAWVATTLAMVGSWVPVVRREAAR
jgi:tellurite resistance protein TehA-like permease